MCLDLRHELGAAFAGDGEGIAFRDLLDGYDDFHAVLRLRGVNQLCIVSGECGSGQIGRQRREGKSRFP